MSAKAILNAAAVGTIKAADAIPFKNVSGVVTGKGLSYPYYAYDCIYMRQELNEGGIHPYTTKGTLTSAWKKTSDKDKASENDNWKLIYLPVTSSREGDLQFASDIGLGLDNDAYDIKHSKWKKGHYSAWRKGGVGNKDTRDHMNNEHWWTSRLGNSLTHPFGCYISDSYHLGRVPRMRNETLPFTKYNGANSMSYDTKEMEQKGVKPIYKPATSEYDRYNVVFDPNPVNFTSAPQSFPQCVKVDSKYLNIQSAVSNGNLEPPHGVSSVDFQKALAMVLSQKTDPTYSVVNGTAPTWNSLTVTASEPVKQTSYSIDSLTLYKTDAPDMLEAMNSKGSLFLSELKDFLNSKAVELPASIRANANDYVIVGIPTVTNSNMNGYYVHLIRCFNKAVTAMCNDDRKTAIASLKSMFVNGNGQLYSEGIASFFIPRIAEKLGLIDASNEFGYLNEGTLFFPTQNGTTMSSNKVYNANETDFVCASVPLEDELSNIRKWGIPTNSDSLGYNSSSTFTTSYNDHLSAKYKECFDKKLLTYTAEFAKGGNCSNESRNYVGQFRIPFKATLYINSDYCERKHRYYSNGIENRQTMNVCCHTTNSEDRQSDNDGWRAIEVWNACMARFGYDCFYFDWKAVRGHLRAYGEGLAKQFSKGGVSVLYMKGLDNDLGAINRAYNKEECPSKYITSSDTFLSNDISFKIARQVNKLVGTCKSDQNCGHVNPGGDCLAGRTKERYHETQLWVPRDELINTNLSIQQVLTSVKGSADEDTLHFMEDVGFTDGKRTIENTFPFEISFTADLSTVGKIGTLCPYKTTKNAYFITRDVVQDYAKRLSDEKLLGQLLDSLKPALTETCYKLAYLDRLVKPFLETVDTSVLLFDLPLGPPAMHNTETNILSFQYYMGEYEFPKGKDVTDMTIYERGVDKDTYLDATLVDMLQKEAMMIPVSEVPYTKDGKRVNADLDKVSIVVKIPENASRLLTIPRISVDKKPLSYITYTNESYNGKPSGAESITDSTCLVFNVLGPKTAGEKRMNGDYETLDGKLTVPMVSIKTESVESDRSWTVSISSVDMYCHASKGKLNTSTIGGNSLAFSYLDGVSWTDKAFMEPGLFETV